MANTSLKGIKKLVLGRWGNKDILKSQDSPKDHSKLTNTFCLWCLDSIDGMEFEVRQTKDSNALNDFTRKR